MGTGVHIELLCSIMEKLKGIIEKLQRTHYETKHSLKTDIEVFYKCLIDLHTSNPVIIKTDGIDEMELFIEDVLELLEVNIDYLPNNKDSGKKGEFDKELGRLDSKLLFVINNIKSALDI